MFALLTYLLFYFFPFFFCVWVNFFGRCYKLSYWLLSVESWLHFRNKVYNLNKFFDFVICGETGVLFSLNFLDEKVVCPLLFIRFLKWASTKKKNVKNRNLWMNMGCDRCGQDWCKQQRMEVWMWLRPMCFGMVMKFLLTM